MGRASGPPIREHGGGVPRRLDKPGRPCDGARPDQARVPMPDNPLFYRDVVALDREAHAGLRFRAGPPPLGFARFTHLVPAVADEFPAACRELPILFVASAGAPSPAFLLGVRPDRNLLIDDAGAWRGSYVPAYLRRYPFIKGEVPGSEPIVCVDPGAELFAGDGEPLFAGGEPAPLLRERIELVNGYADAAQRTEALSRLLVELGLLKDVTIDFKLAEGASAIHGLLAVDEAKLNGLADADFLKLRQGGFLAALYAHLLSLAAIDQVAKRAGV